MRKRTFVKSAHRAFQRTAAKAARSSNTLMWDASPATHRKQCPSRQRHKSGLMAARGQARGRSGRPKSSLTSDPPRSAAARYNPIRVRASGESTAGSRTSFTSTWSNLLTLNTRVRLAASAGSCRKQRASRACWTSHATTPQWNELPRREQRTSSESLEPLLMATEV